MTEDDLAPEGVPEVLDAPVEGASEPEQHEEESPTLEAVAANMGWAPKDQWRGDPDRWKPADKFIAATADINSKLGSSIKRLEDQVTQMARTSAVVTEKALAEQREKILAQRVEAIDMGDHAAVDEADKALRAMPQLPQVAPPEAEAWVAKHSSWFGKDAEATAWAQRRAGELADQGLGASRQLAIVEKEMANYFPDLMPSEKPKPASAPLSQPGKRAGGQATAKTFANLPADAKKAAQDFAKNGRCTVEEYAKIYFEEQA